ncbi:MAG: hypothetical protein AAGD05_08965, partial [Bacteroidota bacterium]
KIIDIEMKISPIDKLYQTGTIKFYAGRTLKDDEGSVQKLHDDWYFIENPQKVVQKLNALIQASKKD